MFTSFFLFMCKSFYLILISIFSTSMLMILEESIVLNFDMNSFTELPFSITFLIDKKSLIFISTVSTVSSMIIIYSFYYFEQETKYMLKKFLFILIAFIIFMFILSLSANSFWLMIGWDGLGISSFCLIIFYQNWKSFSSGMVTFLSNRFGDTLIIMSMVWIMFNQSCSSWSFPKNIFIISFLMTFGAYSKSSQLPYSFWLPQAMAAPTPVSALVHSSTLVTAGIFVMCRFQPVENYYLLIFLFVLSSITVIIAGTSSVFEFDLKKIIALSTLCHISLMMMFCIMNEIYLSLFHLMTHAFFKSLLFMTAGLIIHDNSNSQDIRFIKIAKMNLSISFPFFLATFSMMGFPFMSGFYSKESLLTSSSFILPSLLMIFMFLMNSFFSCAYSTRLMVFLFLVHKAKPISHWFKSPVGNVLVFSSVFSSFIGGSMMPFIVLEENEMVQSSAIKNLLAIFSFLGIMLGMMISMNFSKQMMNSLSEFWKYDFIYKIFQKHFFFLSSSIMWAIDEKGISKMVQLMLIKKCTKLSSFSFFLFLKEPFSVIKILHFSMMMMSFWMM